MRHTNALKPYIPAKLPEKYISRIQKYQSEKRKNSICEQIRSKNEKRQSIKTSQNGLKPVWILVSQPN